MPSVGLVLNGLKTCYQIYSLNIKWTLINLCGTPSIYLKAKEEAELSVKKFINLEKNLDLGIGSSKFKAANASWRSFIQQEGIKITLGTKQ